MPYKIKRKKITLLASLGTLVLLAIGMFVISNMRDLLFGTPLVIHTARDGATLEDGFLPMTGNARHARSVLINGRTVFLDREGNFADAVLLSPGYNVVEVTLQDQFGKTKVKTYHLVLNEANAVAQLEEAKHNY